MLNNKSTQHSKNNVGSGTLKGIGLGTIAAAILVGRWVQLYNSRFTFIQKYLPKEN